ncbi:MULTISPECIES: winged helix-turn-helix domain-containing protein [Micromonosporaceae]|uniref:winged helix-turn-helix domain-containing protein n=1 Tax=Micromonosporaceae TaxID=28056 RepID=UPI002DD9AA41|nr:winged helix-turn-helix domain-containing protein [Micromonospora sp. NBC_01813]WSA07022.1 winged helix-turn-helix domain-containing protein [Micromonospora sp. NBC_01813]
MPTPSQPAEPVYRRIMRAIETAIATGELKPGDKLPSTAQLCEQYGCSAPTARQALARLQERGVLQGHQGRGVYVTYAPE